MSVCVIQDKEKAAVAKKSFQRPAAETKEGKREDEKMANNQRQIQEASADQINEFFGEARKSSTRQLQTGFEGDSDLEEVTVRERRHSYSDKSGGTESDTTDEVKSADFDLEELTQKRLRFVLISTLGLRHWDSPAYMCAEVSKYM